VTNLKKEMQMKEYTFTIFEPKDKVFTTHITLDEWIIPDIPGRKNPGGRSLPNREYVIQLPLKWLYRRNIEAAKLKLIKRYLVHLETETKNDKTWKETISL